MIAGADVRHVRLTDGVDFFAELESAILNNWPKPKVLVLNFPGNPTTHCVELEFFERVVAIAKAHGIWVVQDLAYADIVFDGYTRAINFAGSWSDGCCGGVFYLYLKATTCLAGELGLCG